MDVPFLIRGGGVLLFGYAALMDWRYRRVQNHVWLSIATLGVIALLLELRTAADPVAIVGGVAVAVFAIGMLAVTGFANGMIGGADAKAAMVLPVIFPHLPGDAFRNTVSGTLTQGVEGVIWVWIGTAIAGVWYTAFLNDESEDGIPFLVPFFAGVVSLFFISVFVA